MNIFVVSLKRATERRKKLLAHLHEVGVEFEFIDGVCGKSLTDEEVGLIVDQGRMSKGEIGCAGSHKFIYEKIVSDNIEYALVLEDDVCVKSEITTFLSALNRASFSWDIILLGHHCHGSRSVNVATSIWSRFKLAQFTLGKPTELANGTYGYCVSQEGAKKLLNQFPLSSPIDHYTGNPNEINVYAVKDPIVLIDDYLSSNFSEMGSRNAVKLNSREQVIKKSIIKKYLSKLGVLGWLRVFKFKMKYYFKVLL